MSTLTKSIEARLSEDVGVDLAVEEDGDTIVVTGSVESDRLRAAALEIAENLAVPRRVESDIEISAAVPRDVYGVDVSETQIGMFAGAEPGTEEDALGPDDFGPRHEITDPLAASGPSGMEDDEVSEGDAVYVPPIDPVGTNTEVIGGFQRSSLDSVEVEPSALDGLSRRRGHC